MSLEELERKLYSQKSESAEPAKGRVDTNKERPIPEVWTQAPAQAPAPEHYHFSISKKAIMLGSAAITVVLVAIGAFIILSAARPSGSIELSLDGPDQLIRGVPFEVTVGMSNQLDSLVHAQTVTLSLPPGIIPLSDGASSPSLVSDTVGDIGAGSLAQKKFKLLPVGDMNTTQRITAALTYSAANNSRFDVTKARDFSVTGTAVTLTVTAPDRILRGTPFDVSITYKNTSGFDFPEVALDAQYPSSFKYLSASLAPDSLTNHWNLGALKAGSQGTLKVTGTVDGPDAARFGIPATLSAVFLGKSYPIAEQSGNLLMAPSPVSLSVSVNGSADYVARIGDQLQYSIQYQNSSGIALSDVIVKAQIASDLFDPSTISSLGNIDTIQNAITWNGGNTPALKLVSPGSGGTVTFSVRLKPSFSITRLSDKNFTLQVAVELDSPSVPFYLTSSSTSARTTFTTKVGGMVSFASTGFYRDASAAIVNSGTVPPHVNQPTTYTIHWTITNYSTDLTNVMVRSVMQSGVTWTGVVKSNVDSVPAVDSRTGEVTWVIDHIPAGQGVVGSPVEAVFQVQGIPNATQVGQAQPLMSQSIFKATDAFTGNEIDLSDKTISTSLPDDPTVGQAGGAVLP